jgi:hypothetical protein
VFSACSFAWNSTGHELVAQVAFDNLSPGAKNRIVAILMHHVRLTQDLMDLVAPGEDPARAIFLRAATWPDNVRSTQNPLSQKESHPIWHYIDYPYEFDGVKGPPAVDTWDGKSDPQNLIQAMDLMRKQLSNLKTAESRKAIDICWVEHLVGDIHQPLHAVSWFSKEFPDGDRGGNSVIVGNPGDVYQNQPTINLHSLWDGIEGLSMTPDSIRSNADRIEKEHPADSMQSKLADMEVTDWAKESLELARTVVYLNGTLKHTTRGQGQGNLDSAPALPADYEKNAVATADERIALGGYRLAAVLEEIAKEQDEPVMTQP